MTRVAILGGGWSAQTFAADLAIFGWDVSMFEFPSYREKLAHIASTLTIEKYGSASSRRRVGVAKLKQVCFDMREATAGADIIIIAVPAYAHGAFFEEVAKTVTDRQTVLIAPGNWGALRLRRLLDTSRPGNTVKIAETDVCFGPCRAGESFIGPGRVRVIIERQKIKIAAIPSTDTQVVLALLKGPYPELEAVGSVLETSLGNTNPATHAPVMLMNAGWIEHAKGHFMIYRDGATRAVTRAMDQLSTERDNVARAFGVPLPEVKYDAFSRLSGADWVKDPCQTGPTSLNYRYLLEDIPFGLVPLHHLAELANVPIPLTRAMITLASSANETDHLANGLSGASLGLSGLAVDQVSALAAHGTGWAS
jgi:opine dehydrogenase